LALSPGTHLGPYEITAQIGAGGMGEVYRATDSHLKRSVAIKVLPASVAGDADRLARFQREAEVLAALNHPNIAAIYGLEKTEDFTALVMELVEGEDLSAHIARGAIPLGDALPIAKQIADALEAAHEQGIIHRDLKPANIKVRADGTVKVLDFGLAKAMDPAGASTVNAMNSPTLTARATQMGMILGTAAYMAPEQARGKAVDKRADIWAFGVVLYEMLTGRRAFDGEDVSLTLAAVMKSEPDLTALPTDLPASVRACLARCLQKDPRQRLRDVGDVRLVLQGEFEFPATAGAAVVPTKTALWRRALPPVAAAIVTGVGVGLAVWYYKPLDPRPVTRFEHVLPGELLFRSSPRRSIAASPDGRRFVYNAADGIYLHSLDQPGDRQLLASTVTVTNPVFSPDGQTVAYHQGGQLKRLATTGGAPVVIATTPSPNGISWAEDGTLLYAVSEGINRVTAQGGTPELVVRALDGEMLLSPQILPGGQTVLFSSVRAGNVATGTVNQRESQAVAQSLRSGERKVLMPGASDARYVHSGHLVYTVGDGLFAVGFDAKAIEVIGGAVSILEGIRRGSGATPVALAEFDVSGDGALFYLGGAGNLAGSPLVWVSRDGRTEPIAAIPPHGFTSPRLSADGKRLLVVAQGDVRIYDLATGRETRLTSDRAAGSYAEWVPGEQSVTYSSTRSGQAGLMNIWIQPLDGTGRATQMTNLDGQVHVDSWTPDGRVLAAHLHPPTGSPDILLFQGADATGSRPTKLVENSASETDATFSPDGRFVAYLDAVSGQNEVVIRPFPGPGRETPVSVGGGREPVWSRHGELFYRRTSDDMMMVVRVATKPALTVGPPRELFRGAGTPGGSPRASYSVTADGQRFIMSGARVASGLRRDAAAARPRINIVLNWVEELKARVPTK
jgi:Tol biopolymer transport system component